MTEPHGSSFNKRIQAINQNMEQRSELSRSMAAFMLSVSEIVRDPRLIKVTNRFWTPNTNPDPDNMHRFSCMGAKALDLPQDLYIGEPITPNHFHTFIDPQATSYHISEKLTSETIRELVLVLSDPRDNINARWEATVVDYGVYELGDTNLTPQSEAKIEASDFSILSNAIQTSLLGVRPTGATFVRDNS